MPPTEGPSAAARAGQAHRPNRQAMVQAARRDERAAGIEQVIERRFAWVATGGLPVGRRAGRALAGCRPALLGDADCNRLIDGRSRRRAGRAHPADAAVSRTSTRGPILAYPGPTQVAAWDRVGPSARGAGYGPA